MEAPLHNQTKPLLPLPLPAPTMADRQHHHIAAAVELTELPPAKFGPPDLDETDYSTSFADTASTNQNNSATLSDTEVESQFYSDVNGFSSPFDDFGTVLRVRCVFCLGRNLVCL